MDDRYLTIIVKAWVTTSFVSPLPNVAVMVR
jgi:hypothetical protein